MENYLLNPQNTMRYKMRYFIWISLLWALMAASCQVIKSLGQNPSGNALNVMEQQPNYRHGHFENPEGEDSVNVGLHTFFRDRPDNSRPKSPLPVIKTDLVNTRYAAPTVIWFGHSSFLLKTRTANVLVDPVFSGNAGPVKGLIKAFDGTNVYSVKDIPDIDVLVISHDHYDHLDYRTILALKNKVKKVIVPKGVGSHLRYWGYDPKIIHELNWNDSVKINPGLTITAVRTRHTSRRSFSGQKTLWASYVIRADGYRLFYSGDGGYGTQFKETGRQYGPFDLALLECGQYDRDWAHHHMFPDQTAQAAADLGAKMILPVHWGKFAEAYHAWNAPVKEMLAAAERLRIPVSVPRIGEAYTLGSPALLSPWWDTY